MDHHYRPRVQSYSQLAHKKKMLAWLLCGAVITGIVLLVLFTRVLPRAVVTLQLEIEQEDVKVPVVFDVTRKESDVGAAILAGRSVTVEVSKAIEMQAVTKEDIGTPAKGKVLVKNRTGKTYDVLPDALFRGQQGIQYFVSSAVTVPGASVSAIGEIIPGSKEVSIIAKQGGERSNLAAGQLVLEGLSPELTGKIFAEIGPDGIQGGASHVVTVVGEDDLENAYESIYKDVQELLIEKLKRTLTKEEAMPEEMLEKKEITLSDPVVHSETQKFNYTLTTIATGISFRQQDLIGLMKSKTASGADGKIKVVPEDIQKYSFDEIIRDNAKGTVQAKVLVSLINKPDINKDDLKGKIVGMEVPEARRILLSQENIKNVKLVNKYGLSNSLPRSIDKIEIIIE